MGVVMSSRTDSSMGCGRGKVRLQELEEGKRYLGVGVGGRGLNCLTLSTSTWETHTLGMPKMLMG